MQPPVQVRGARASDLVDVVSAISLPDHEQMDEEDVMPVVEIRSEHSVTPIKPVITMRPLVLTGDLRRWFEHGAKLNRSVEKSLVPQLHDNALALLENLRALRV